MNHRTTDDRQYVNKDEKLKIQNYDPNKLTGVPVIVSTLKNETTPVYDSNLSMFVYRDYMDIKNVGYYSATFNKAQDMALDTKYNIKYYVVLVQDSKIQLLYDPYGKVYIQWRNQDISNSGLPPANPIDKQQWVATTYIYQWDGNLKYWAIIGEPPKTDASYQNIKVNVIQPISNILEFKDNNGTTSLGNIDSTSNKLTWQNDLDVKGKATVTGNISSGATISATTRVVAPEIKTNSIQPTSLDGTSLVRMYDSGGNLQITLNPTTPQTIFTKDVVDKENVSIEKDLSVTGKIVNSDLTQRLLKAGSFVPKTKAERLLYQADPINVSSNIKIWDTTLDKELHWINGVCYEPSTMTIGVPNLPTLGADGEFYFDTNNQILYQFVLADRYWKIKIDDMITNTSNISTTANIDLNPNDYIKVTNTSGKMTIGLGTTRNTNRYKYVLRAISSSNILKSGTMTVNNNFSMITVVNDISDGTIYDFTVVDEKAYIVYGYRFAWCGTQMNGVFMRIDRWEEPFSQPTANDYELCTTAERIAGAINLPLYMKTYYDVDLKKVLICRNVSNNKVFADFDSIYEDITFPLD